MPIADRMKAIAPFRVMAILAEARRLEAQGKDIVHMEIGEPDFVSPTPVISAGRRALDAGRTHYTPATGLPALRSAIAGYYEARFGIDVPPGRIIVTPGASGALQLALAALINPGDRVVIPDPAYPCNRHMVALFDGEVVDLPVDRAQGFQVAPERLKSCVDTRTRMLMMASPANPTGQVNTGAQLAQMNDILRARSGAYLLCDEIYQGLQYEGPIETAAAMDADNVIVINSFSKFFGMTGWRIGWMVVPEPLADPVDRLAQNLFLAPPTLSQYAALSAFDAESMAVLEDRRLAFQQRRDFLYAALVELEFDPGPRPAGAFYLYADASGHTQDSAAFCADLLRHEGVALTPGVDFGRHLADRQVRFAYTTSLDRLEIGVERIRRFLRAGA